MGKVSKQVILLYNKCEALATKFSNILDSFWHKDEKIPLSALEENPKTIVTESSTANNAVVIDGNGSAGDPYEIFVPVTDISDKVDKVAGKGLSKNDLTDARLSKLNNQPRPYNAGRTVTADEGIIRVDYEGSTYQYIGAFDENNNTSFTFVDFATELAGGRFELVVAGVALASIDVISPTMIAKNSNYRVDMFGWNFEKDMIVQIISNDNLIADLVVTGLVVTNQNQAYFYVDSNNDIHDYELLITTRSGTYHYPTPYQVTTETVIIPNALTWTVTLNQFLFADGKANPDDLNVKTRNAFFNLIPANLDFDLEFTWDYQETVPTGTVFGNVWMMLYRQDDTSFYNLAFIGQTPYLYNDLQSGFVTQGGFGRYAMFRRVNGIISYLSGLNYPATVTRNSYPNVTNDALKCKIALTGHAGLKDIKLTIRL